MFSSCGLVAPKSGFWVLRYRKYQLVSTLRLRRLVIRPALLLAPVAWLPCKFANGDKSMGTSPFDFRYAARNAAWLISSSVLSEIYCGMSPSRFCRAAMYAGFPGFG